ncbi:hypothetical protein Dimus_030249 [Dionaea muscipula]
MAIPPTSVFTPPPPTTSAPSRWLRGSRGDWTRKNSPPPTDKREHAHEVVEEEARSQERNHQSRPQIPNHRNYPRTQIRKMGHCGQGWMEEKVPENPEKMERKQQLER